MTAPSLLTRAADLVAHYADEMRADHGDRPFNSYAQAEYDKLAALAAELRAAELATPPAPESAQPAEIDAVYEERNRVVALLAKLFPAGIKRTAIEGWDPEWHGCVFIDLPTGQASWHFHDSQAHLFASLPEYAGELDGHSTPEKYERVARVEADAARGKGE